MLEKGLAEPAAAAKRRADSRTAHAPSFLSLFAFTEASASQMLFCFGNPSRKRAQRAKADKAILKIKSVARYGFEALLKPREFAHGRLSRARRRSEAEGGFPYRRIII